MIKQNTKGLCRRVRKKSDELNSNFFVLKTNNILGACIIFCGFAASSSYFGYMTMKIDPSDPRLLNNNNNNNNDGDDNNNFIVAKVAKV